MRSGAGIQTNNSKEKSLASKEQTPGYQQIDVNFMEDSYYQPTAILGEVELQQYLWS